MKKIVIGVIVGIVIMLGLVSIGIFSEPEDEEFETIDDVVTTGKNLSVNLNEHLNMNTGP